MTVLLLATAVVYLLWGDREAEADEQVGASASRQPADRLATFPPPLIDARHPISSDAKPVELCGYGQILTKPGEYPYPASVLASARKLLERVTDQLETADAAGTRAAAVYYRAIQQRATAAAAFVARNPLCEQDPACPERFYLEGLQALRRAADQLAASVATTRDGSAYVVPVRESLPVSSHDRTLRAGHRSTLGRRRTT